MTVEVLSFMCLNEYAANVTDLEIMRFRSFKLVQGSCSV